MITGLISKRRGFSGSWQYIAAITLASFVAAYVTAISSDYFPVRGIRFAVAVFFSITVLQTLAEWSHGETFPKALIDGLASGAFIGVAGGLGMILASLTTGGSLG